MVFVFFYDAKKNTYGSFFLACCGRGTSFLTFYPLIICSFASFNNGKRRSDSLCYYQYRLFHFVDGLTLFRQELYFPDVEVGNH